MIKKLSLFALLVVGLFTIAACNNDDVILVDETYDYYITGQFADWGNAFANEDYKMEAIALNDERISSIKDDLDGAELLYVIEATFSAEDAGWTVSYTIDGVEIEVTGNQTVKFARIEMIDGEAIPTWWAPSPESGEINNLTPDTLYIPNYVDPDGDDFVDGLGSWNDNPIMLDAGTYTMVFAYIDGVRWLGAIEVTE
ncbi:MAG: hypothetical protein PF513_07495 [Tenericutes bacterium]|jgi:hypothetical protein|nr:hypothetical protein [Mycoplasmatota bacterium]